MKVSFPHMGCVTGYKRLFEKLGHEVVMPKRPTQSTMELGVKYSPEFICIPFKVMTGTYIECAEAGAEIIVSSGGCGPCRAGMYPDVHQKILSELGYKTKVIVFDSPFKDFKKFWGIIREITNNQPLFKVAKYGLFCFKLICAMDKLEKQRNILRAYEKNQGDFNYAWNKIVKMFEKCENSRDVKKAYKKAQEMFDKIPKREVAEKDKIRVGIVGEIYVVMESAVNKNVEEHLNALGIEVENVQYISDWIKHNVVPEWISLFPKSHRVDRLSNHISPLNCGGHEKENMGWVYDFKKRGFDGVVHLMPFACLPELVNLGKFPAISKELDLPILSLSLDEQMGEAHVKTRLEAFSDLIKSKHNAKAYGREKGKAYTTVKPNVAKDAVNA